MGELSARNFGLIIAVLVPGFVVLWGTSYLSEPVRLWLFGADGSGPSASGAVYVLVASMGAGMAAGAVRWAVIDSFHHATGVSEPRLDFRKLEDRLVAFYALVDNHYRYYQFYANSLVACAVAYAAYRFGPTGPHGLLVWPDVWLLLLILVLGAASRDALRRYYVRAEELLGSTERTVSHDKRIRSRRRIRRRETEQGRSEKQSGEGSPREGGEAGLGPERPDGDW